MSAREKRSVCIHDVSGETENESQISHNSVLHARGGHDGVEHHGEELLLVALGGAQHHQPVLNRRAVQVVQGHVLRRGQRLRVNSRRRLVEDDVPQMRRQSRWPKVRIIDVLVLLNKGTK